MMNAITKNALAISCFVEGFCKVISEDQTKVSNTLAKKIKALRVANNEAMEALPHPEDKEVSQIARRIARVERYVVTMKQPHKIVTLSFLLGLIEDARLTGRRQDAFEALHSRVKTMHRYFDRTLAHNEAYSEASFLIKKWGMC